MRCLGIAIISFCLAICNIPVALVLNLSIAEAGQAFTLESGEHQLRGTICIPKGAGPFPAVVYHHGGAGSTIGGAPKPTCNALAKAGFVGLSLIRRSTKPLYGQLDDANAALNFLNNIPSVDRDRIGVIGFSRGALLAWQQATQRSDISALVIMAAAVNRNLNLNEASKISAPVLVLVARNDTGSTRTRGRNTISFTKKLVGTLEAAKKNVELIIYPAFENDGHIFFFEIRDLYWSDVLSFLKKNLENN